MVPNFIWKVRVDVKGEMGTAKGTWAGQKRGKIKSNKVPLEGHRVGCREEAWYRVLQGVCALSCHPHLMGTVRTTFGVLRFIGSMYPGIWSHFPNQPYQPSFASVGIDDSKFSHSFLWIQYFPNFSFNFLSLIYSLKLIKSSPTLYIAVSHHLVEKANGLIVDI